jgi:hypothetical protein
VQRKKQDRAMDTSKETVAQFIERAHRLKFAVEAVRLLLPKKFPSLSRAEIDRVVSEFK